MPIDPDIALGMALPEEELEWAPGDVVRYHLALGAGADPADARYLDERNLQVLPTFAMTAPATFGAAAVAFGRTVPSELSLPGVRVALGALVHAGQELVVHQPLPVCGTARARTRITGVHDKGDAAVIEQETEVKGTGGEPLFTGRSSLFVRGGGGFGGQRGPSSPAAAARVPEHQPDAVLDTPTLPQQAWLYRLCGDRNPLHTDPSFARAAGFPRPILQGACTYGIVCKAVVDALLDADATRVLRYSARFSGAVFPGETLRTRVWRSGSQLEFATTALERREVLVLSGDAAIAVAPRSA